MTTMAGDRPVASERLPVDLGGFSPAALIDAIIRLTHAIHDTPNEDLRAQRDLARWELLRRTA